MEIDFGGCAEYTARIQHGGGARIRPSKSLSEGESLTSKAELGGSTPGTGIYSLRFGGSGICTEENKATLLTFNIFRQSSLISRLSPLVVEQR